jgi:A/G-specific adenine glycosylase
MKNFKTGFYLPAGADSLFTDTVIIILYHKGCEVLQENALHHINPEVFRQNLLAWYHHNKRDLPWRKDRDPYKIWVSEVMLQQTKVDTVIPYFNQFMMDYPSVYELADADEQNVLKSWEGLGYYSRARNLQNAIREVVADYGGRIPDDPKTLGTLKGVGPYTKGAILSIAFGQPEPAVDGNVMRVLSRILNIKEDITLQRTKRLFEEHIRTLISREDPSAFNQGIMELGALICTPKTPMCMLCPVQEHCLAFAEGIQEQLPVKKKAKKQKTLAYAALLIKNSKDEYLIEQRGDQGLLAGLWQFPMVPLKEVPPAQITAWIEKEYGLKIILKEKKGNLKHVFTHLIWQLDIYEAEAAEQNSESGQLTFVPKRNLKTYPFPVSHVKMMKYL